MGKILNRHKTFWLQKNFLFNAGLGLALLAVSFFVSYFANSFTLSHASNSVRDIILDNVPVYDVSWLFLDGGIAFLLILVVILVLEPKFIPFTLKTIALFILVRSFFMILTHLAAPVHDVIQTDNFLERMLAGSGDDLFFSGHTGLPFMLGFIFWDQKFFRWFFFACSAIGGVAVLLGHLHYSIDVFSALFISFGIYHLARNFFPKDFKLMTT